MQIRYYFESQIARAFLGVCWLIGLRAGSWLGGRLGWVLSKMASERKIAEDNLARALPHLSAPAQAEILRQNWIQVGRVLGEFPHLRQIYAQRDTRLLFEGTEHVKAARAYKQTGNQSCPVIFVSGHLANWEVLVMGIRQLVHHTGALYRRSSNPYVEAWIAKQRAPFMSQQIAKGQDGARATLDMLKSGTSLAVLIDQKLDTGDPISFFGRPTKAPSAPIKMARRFDIPIVPVVVRRRHDAPDKAHYKLVFHPPIHVAQTADKQADIRATLRQLYALLEAWITAHPEEWLWMHNRWRK